VLNLASQSGRLIAAMLGELALYEGNCKNWRSITHEGYHAFSEWGAPSEWVAHLPDHGVLKLDFISFIQPPKDAEPISEDDLAQLIRRMGDRWTAAETKISSLRVAASRDDFYITTAQVRRLIKLFSWGDERSEVVIIFFSKVCDRENMWKLLYSLEPMDQMFVIHRLGVQAIYDPRHPSMHYRLDFGDAEQEAFGRKHVAFAQKDQKRQSWSNIHISGRRLNMVPEGETMWSLLTTESFTPVVEVDFMGEDCPPEMCKTRQKQMAFQRAKTLHPYFRDYYEKTYPELYKNAKGAVPAALELPPGSAEGGMRASIVGAGPLGIVSPDERPSTAPDREPVQTLAERRMVSIDRRQAGQRRGGLAHLLRPSEAEELMEGGDNKEAGLGSGAMLAANAAARMLVKKKNMKQAAKRTWTRLETRVAESPSGRTMHWQVAWDTLMRQVVHADAKYLPPGKTPLEAYFFDKLDADGGGEITLDEMQADWKNVFGYDLDSKRLVQLFMQADIDGEGGIDWSEFEQLAMSDSFVHRWGNTIDAEL